MCKMRSIGQTGRQLHCQMIEHVADSKLDFKKKLKEKKKDKFSGTLGHLKKTKNQLDWNSIKIMYWKFRPKEG